MKALRNRFEQVLSLVAGLLVLLAGVVVTLDPASAQSGDSPTCATGGAVADAANNPGLVSDCEALLEARDTLAGAATLNWSAATPIGEWQGITLQGTPLRVARLDIRAGELDGSIPAALGRLSNLTYLNLRSNDLDGPIPTELGGLTNLRILNLHSNRLSGTIPDLSGIAGLEELYLSNNDLSGGVPAWLGTMTGMKELWLWGNELSGTIPDLSGMTGLIRLKLQSNDLTGGIPAWFGEMTNLVYLYLHINPLSGEIPSELGGMRSLRYLWLHSNELTGSIPAELGQLYNLWDLNLRDNRLSGSIPPELGDLNSLILLRLHGNELTGEIPAELGYLRNLEALWLHMNSLSGPVPHTLGRLSNLKRLWLSGNELTGQIPHELGYLRNISAYRLADNRFTGCLPIGLRRVGDNDLANLGLQVCGILAIEPPSRVEPVIANLPAVIRPRVTYAGNSRLSYSLAGQPDGMSIDFNTGTITWTPRESDEGRTIDLVVRVTDGARFAQTGFQVTVVEPEEIETEVTESATEGNKLVVTDTGTNLNGLETTSPTDAPPITAQSLRELQTLFEKVPRDSVPEIPSYITPISDVFLVKGLFDNPVEFRFPVARLPEEVSLDDVNLYAYTEAFGSDLDVDEKLWIPVLEDWSFAGTAEEPVFVVELAAMYGMAFFGYHHSSPPDPFPSNAARYGLAEMSPATASWSPDASQIVCEPENEYFGGLVGGKNYNVIICRYGPDPDVKIKVKNFGRGTRWGSATVEDLAKWAITAQLALEELNLDYKKNITIRIEDAEGAAGRYLLQAPGSFILAPDIKTQVLGAEATTYHEYFHLAQFHTAPLSLQLGWRLGVGPGFSVDRKWLTEGSADWFEDVVNDSLNLYGKIPDIMSVGLDASKSDPPVNGIAPAEAYVVDDRYNPAYNRYARHLDPRYAYARHAFFMLLDRRCEGFRANVRHLLGEVVDPLPNLRGVISDSNCDFGDHLGSERSSELASAITYYVYASLFKNDRRLFDSDSSVPKFTDPPVGFGQVPEDIDDWPSPFTSKEYRLEVESWAKDEDDEPVRVPVNVVPAVGAFSFKVFSRPLPHRDAVAELVVNASRGQELIISITCELETVCRHDPFEQAFNDVNTIGEDQDLHTWFSTRDANSHIIARGRLPTLGMTIANPSLSEDVNVEVFLRIRRETQLTVRPEFTSHSEGDRITNRVIAVGGVFPQEVRDEITRVVIAANGLKSETTMQSNGTFREQVVMFLGDNTITAQGFNGETPVTQAARLTLEGVRSTRSGRNQLVPSRVGFVLRWDTGSTDVDIYSTDKESRTIYWRNENEHPGFLDIDDIYGYGPEVVSYRALEHTIYRNGTFDVDVHYYNGRGVRETNFTLDVILNETEVGNRRLHRYKSVTPLTRADGSRSSGPNAVSGPSRFNDVLNVECSRAGVCQVADIDESKLATVGTTGSGDASPGSETYASGRCSQEGVCELDDVEVDEGKLTPLDKGG